MLFKILMIIIVIIAIFNIGIFVWSFIEKTKLRKKNAK